MILTDSVDHENVAKPLVKAGISRRAPAGPARNSQNYWKALENIAIPVFMNAADRADVQII